MSGDRDKDECGPETPDPDHYTDLIPFGQPLHVWAIPLQRLGVEPGGECQGALLRRLGEALIECRDSTNDELGLSTFTVWTGEVRAQGTELCLIGIGVAEPQAIQNLLQRHFGQLASREVSGTAGSVLGPTCRYESGTIVRYAGEMGADVREDHMPGTAGVDRELGTRVEYRYMFPALGLDDIRGLLGKD